MGSPVSGVTTSNTTTSDHPVEAEVRFQPMVATDVQILLDQFKELIANDSRGAKPKVYDFTLAQSASIKKTDFDLETGEEFVISEEHYRKTVACEVTESIDESVGQGSNWSMYGATVTFQCETQTFDASDALLETCSEHFVLANLFMYGDENRTSPDHAPTDAKSYAGHIKSEQKCTPAN